MYKDMVTVEHEVEFLKTDIVIHQIRFPMTHKLTYQDYKHIQRTKSETFKLGFQIYLKSLVNKA